MTKLAKLERIESAKQVLRFEAKDYTPWLASDEGLSLLSESLGQSPDWLERIDEEVRVGEFIADIICRETVHPERTVVIENQYGPTDHGHLGQILTYAAGKDALVLIWVAEKIREDHAAAISYLNQLTDPSFQAFVLEIEFWTIGDSEPAPRFNIVSKPNGWSRAEKARTKAALGNLTPTRKMQRDYWDAVEKQLSETGDPLTPVTAQPQSWISHGIGKSGVLLGMAMHTRENWIRAEVYLGGPNAKERFQILWEQRDEIASLLKLELDWQELPDKNDCRVAVMLEGADPNAKNDWQRQHKWLIDTASEIHKVFGPYVKRLA